MIYCSVKLKQRLNLKRRGFFDQGKTRLASSTGYNSIREENIR